MKTQIFKTENDAIESAKLQCIREMELQFDVIVEDNQMFENDKLWLVRNTSAHCACGECSAREAVLLTSYITDEVELPKGADEVYSNICGICENCGEGELPEATIEIFKGYKLPANRDIVECSSEDDENDKVKEFFAEIYDEDVTNKPIFNRVIGVINDHDGWKIGFVNEHYIDSGADSDFYFYTKRMI